LVPPSGSVTITGDDLRRSAISALSIPANIAAGSTIPVQDTTSQGSVARRRQPLPVANTTLDASDHIGDGPCRLWASTPPGRTTSIRLPEPGADRFYVIARRMKRRR
jgi:hypothetical protein